MGFFTRTPTAGTGTATEARPATKPLIEERPFGAQVSNLTRFGNTWLNLSECIAIEFDPPDGCGSEIAFRNQDTDWHIPIEDAAVLRKYLESFDSIKQQVDSASR